MELDDSLFTIFEAKVPDEEDEEIIVSKKRKYTEIETKAENLESMSKLSNDLPTSDQNIVKDNEIISTKKIKLDTTSSLDVPCIEIRHLDAAPSCTHEVALPGGFIYEGLPFKPDEPAKKYPFILDPFQQEAIRCLDNNQSVLVSAHTSAGKTVIAEYAIAMSLQKRQRVIYTTPIKALSNQKYREMYEEFQDVGLMTGDVTINPNASVIIMTTEILRSMLYRGSEIMREVAWVVFDEIHYMRDKERGVVWEETIILLPDNVRHVFLSATIHNARQFAEWIAYLHKQPCHVVYTDFRPTPLQHYIYPSGGDGLHLVVDEKGDFREENFNKAMSSLQDQSTVEGNAQGKTKKGKGNQTGSNVYKIVKMIMERNYAPVIIFSFSKKECEGYALQMSKLDFNTAEEKKLVGEVFKNAIDCLSDDDKKLPQVEHVLPLLKRGIGIHHGGLLPILKEVIEILFSEGLIKALFATETFALGLNMPARTVLFTSARKFDGKDYRWITSGEYIQMSGRAGRRGIDERGIVIMIVDEKLEPEIGKGLLKGQSDPLNSAFRLTYNMVLNLLRLEEINPEFMLEKSFYQFQNYSAIPEMIDKIKRLESKRDAIEIPNEDSVMSYYKIRQQLKKLSSEMLEYIHQPKYLLPFLQPGRLVHVKNDEDDFDWGTIVNFQKKSNQKQGSVLDEPIYVVEVLLYCAKTTKKLAGGEVPLPCKPDEKGEMQVVPVLSTLLQAVSSIRLYLPKDLRPSDARHTVYKSLQEVKKRFPDGVPLLDPIEDMNIKDEELKKIVRKIEALESRLYSHALHKDKDLETVYNLCQKKAAVDQDIKIAKKELKKAKTILQMDELKCRKRVLRRLGYATAGDVIELKGRVACEISSADELLLTEMIFNGVFNDLTVDQITALLSCFVFQEKGDEVAKLSETLAGPLRQMKESARRIAKISEEAKMEIDVDEYIDSFKPQMMDVVYAWSTGSTFADICKMTDVFEGSVIRCMRRLDELLRQMCQAAKAIGNTELENKFSDGITKIKRDIIFAASLYL
ncbi:exosome RNA helicase MTR4 isoform X2 [Hydra vulgaris]|uniref:Exosome RNA helicase MTR4 isoform X2 n=1 Tax=Hydra vulgaris TaxID=6087 RepID=A0ABM4C704_HYDVU